MITDWILELAALAVILTAGASVFYFVVRAPERYARLERLAYCYPLGMAALGVPMLLLSWAGYHLDVFVITAISLGALAVARLMRKTSLKSYWLKPGEKEKAQAQSFTEFEWLLLVIIVTCLGMRLITSMLAPLNDNDGIAEWGFKAKILYYDTLKTTDYYQKAEYGFSNQSYPLLWPFMYAWMCTVLGKWDDLGMLFLNPINCIAFAVLLYYAARRYAHRTVALGITAIMASLPALLHYTECGQADVPMMMMAGAIFFCLFDWMNTGSLDSILLAGFLMGGGLFLKREGVVIFVAYGCAAVLSAWVGRGWADRRQRFKQLLLFSLVAWGWALPWFIFGRRITNWNAFSGRVSIDTIRWNDLGGALLFILNGSWHFYNAIHLPKWNILWPAFALTVVVSKSAWRRPWNFIWVAYFLQSAAIILIYLASSGRIAPGTGEEFGLERETLQILPPLWLLLAKCADEQWRIWKTGSVPEPLVGAPIQRKPVAR